MVRASEPVVRKSGPDGGLAAASYRCPLRWTVFTPNSKLTTYNSQFHCYTSSNV